MSAAPWPVDPWTPLPQVPFVVLDIETTGSGADDGITELGAVKVVGGAGVGTFQTLVNPGRAVSGFVTLLTGITDQLLAPAPPVEAALPAFLEFCDGAVVVGHNVSFDLGFLDAACERLAYPKLARPAIDTLMLARRLVREDVVDCRLDTLAEQLRLDHHPRHRALDDALATADLLHALIERATAWDVFALDDLVHLPRVSRHRRADQLRLTAALPRSPGIYRFVGRGDEVLYVGTATNLRTRVRSYFGNDDRRMVQPMLRATERIDHVPLPHPLLAQVLEVRELHRLRPRYNRRGARPQRSAYVQLTSEQYPRLRVVRSPGAKGVHLGPMNSSASAQRVVEALQQVLPLRRCSLTLKHGATPLSSACLPAQLGVSACPCAGLVDDAQYSEAVAAATAAMHGDASAVLAHLEDRVSRLSAQKRFEEAGLTRDRQAALSAALDRQRRIAALISQGEHDVELPGLRITIDRGRVVDAPGLERAEAPDVPLDGRPPSPAYADEAMVLSRWLERSGHAAAAA